MTTDLMPKPKEVKKRLRAIAHTDGCFYGKGWTCIHATTDGIRTLCNRKMLSVNWESCDGLHHVNCKICLKRIKKEVQDDN